MRNKHFLYFLKSFLNLNAVGFLSTTILFCILRMAMPFANYVFFPLLCFFLFFTIFHLTQTRRLVFLKKFILYNYQILIISFFVLFGFGISTTYSLFSVKEALYVIVILFLSFSLFLFVNNEDRFYEFTRIFCVQFIYFSSFIGVLGLTKFWFQLKGYELSFLGLYGTSLTKDYNFYVLLSFIGIISILFGLTFFTDKISFFKDYIFSLLILIFSLNIMLSYSRRGLVLLLVIVGLSVILLFYWYHKKKRIFKIVTFYLSSFLFFSLTLGLFTFLPNSIKRNTLNKLGITAKSYKYFASTLLHRYSTIFSNNEYSYFQKIVWDEKPDPFNPDPGWNLRKSTLIFPLSGENVEIVPENSIGYKMDSTCNATTWDNNAYSFTTVTDIFNDDKIPSKNEFLYASVYCFVSKDFDGSWARISTEGKVLGKTINEYNLNNKGTWQKLGICFKSNGSIAPVHLYWAKNNVNDFSKLRGHVIFAYPEYRIINLDPKNPDSGWGSGISTIEFPLKGEKAEIVPQNSAGYKMDRSTNAATWDNNAYSLTDISSLFQGDTLAQNNKFLNASVYCFVSTNFDGSWAKISTEGEVSGNVSAEYDLSKKATWQKLRIDFKAKSGVPPVYLYWSKYGTTDFRNLQGYIIFAYPEYYEDSLKSYFESSSISNEMIGSPIFKSSILDFEMLTFSVSRIAFLFLQDSVRQINEEQYLTYLESDNFSGTRTSRWYYSWLLFKEYPVHKKVFGGGFDYHEKFGTEFGEGKYDYPHNPFLSAFLFSGIIGGLAYIWFMFLVFYYYIKYYRYHLYFFVCFLVTFYFSFFSANTHFSVPIYAILSIIPFLTKYIVENEKNNGVNNKVESLNT